jgi:hypothetical protein
VNVLVNARVISLVNVPNSRVIQAAMDTFGHAQESDQVISVQPTAFVEHLSVVVPMAFRSEILAQAFAICRKDRIQITADSAKI